MPTANPSPRAIFADSFYFIALLNERDAAHVRARQFGDEHAGELVTTEWVLMADHHFEQAGFVALLK